MLDTIVLGLSAAATFENLLVIVIGSVIGLWIGVLPGLGATAAMAILIPFTFAMNPLPALHLRRRRLWRLRHLHPDEHPRRCQRRGHGL